MKWKQNEPRKVIDESILDKPSDGIRNLQHGNTPLCLSESGCCLVNLESYYS